MDEFNRISKSGTSRRCRLLSLLAALLYLAVSLSHAGEVLVPASGEAVVQRLTERYNDIRVDCGGAALPAFLCSGILIRGTVHSPAYHVWNPSPSSVESGGISFSFLRKDAEFNALAMGYDNGFIFSPYQSAKDKVQPEILCSFPIDAATSHRDEHGCGAYYPVVGIDKRHETSRPCQSQALTTVEGWQKTYAAARGYARKYSQCGFEVKGENSAVAFYESIKAMKFTDSFASNNPENEVRMRSWDQDIPKALPIEAFFFIPSLASSRNGAQYNQKDYFEQTDIVVPVVRVTLPRAPSSDATFSFFPEDQVIGLGDAVANLAPKVREASAEDGRRLLLADFYQANQVTVVVPVYAGMAVGQTVGARWKGPSNTYDSPIATVAKVAPVELKIPRNEVIDSIGNTVTVTFSVKRGIHPIQLSAPRQLDIEMQSLVLPAPELNAAHTQVLVRFPAMSAEYHANARLLGATTIDLPLRAITGQEAVVFPIPATWIAQNRGRDIQVTYAVAKKTGGDRWQFSRVLRIGL